jgi:hypothetical protein
MLLLSACTDTRSPEEIVRERAQQRWDALLAGDTETAYGFASPAYRASTTLQRYRGGFGQSVKWISAVVDSVECDAERCEAVIQLTYQMLPNMIQNTRPVEETWIAVEGQWWRHQEK